jgi:hypothetical protein
MTPARRARPAHLRLVTPLPVEAPEPARFIEVAIAWGNNPLRVHHLEAPATFEIKDSPIPGGPIVIDRDGVPHVRVTDRAKNASFVMANGRTSRGVRVADANLFPLLRGHRARFALGPLNVEIAAIDLPPPPPTPRWWRLQWALLIVSLLLNAIVIALVVRG